MNQLTHAFDGPFNEIMRDGTVRLPKQIADAIEASVTQTREGWETTSTAIKSLTDKQLSTARSFGDLALSSTSENIEAATDTILELARTRSLADAQKIQADFISASVARSIRQSKELVALTTQFYADAARTLTASMPNFAARD